MTNFDPRLPQVTCGQTPRITDERGVLTKMFADGAYSFPGFSNQPKQILHSGTARKGTLRGLHAQSAPYTEAKLIFSLTGWMYWVVVDLRSDSQTFGHWQGYELSTADSNALHVPAGFAHGCLSLSDDVNLLIMADKDFASGHGIGIAWNDPDLAIEWPLNGALPLLSTDHAAFPSFTDFCDQQGGL